MNIMQGITCKIQRRARVIVDLRRQCKQATMTSSKLHKYLMENAKIMKLCLNVPNTHYYMGKILKKIKPSTQTCISKQKPEYNTQEGETYLQHTKCRCLGASHLKTYQPSNLGKLGEVQEDKEKTNKEGEEVGRQGRVGAAKGKGGKWEKDGGFVEKGKLASARELATVKLDYRYIG